MTTPTVPAYASFIGFQAVFRVRRSNKLPPSLVLEPAAEPGFGREDSQEVSRRQGVPRTLLLNPRLHRTGLQDAQALEEAPGTRQGRVDGRGLRQDALEKRVGGCWPRPPGAELGEPPAGGFDGEAFRLAAKLQHLGRSRG